MKIKSRQLRQTTNTRISEIDQRLKIKLRGIYGSSKRARDQQARSIPHNQACSKAILGNSGKTWQNQQKFQRIIGIGAKDTEQ